MLPPRVVSTNLPRMLEPGGAASEQLLLHGGHVLSTIRLPNPVALILVVGLMLSFFFAVGVIVQQFVMQFTGSCLCTSRHSK